MVVHPTLWRFLGFGSSIVGFSCFALSSSFEKLFGQWNLLKIILYCTVSFIFSIFVLFVKPILQQFPKVFWWKTRVGFLVLLLTSLYSYHEDQIKEGEPEEKGYKRILSLISFGSFALTSTSVSAQIKPGFEVGVSNFFLGCLIVAVLKMNFVIAVCLAISCYAGFVIRSFLDSQLELQGEGGDTQHLKIEIPTLFHNEMQGLASDMRNGDQEMNNNVIDTVLSSHSSLSIHPSHSTLTHRPKNASTAVDLHSRLLDLENRVALAKLLFPTETKLAMDMAEADSTLVHANQSASKGNLGEVDLNETPSEQNSELQLRLHALQKTVENGWRFFPHCFEVLDKFLEDDTPDVFLEKGTEEEQRLKKARYMELKEDVRKAFYKDKAEIDGSGFSSSSSSPRNASG